MDKLLKTRWRNVFRRWICRQFFALDFHSFNTDFESVNFILKCKFMHIFLHLKLGPQIQ